MRPNVGIAQSVWSLRYMLNVRGILFGIPARARDVSSADRLWVPSSVPFNWKKGFFTLWYNGQAVKPTTHLRLMAKLGMNGVIHQVHQKTLFGAHGQLVQQFGRMRAPKIQYSYRPSVSIYGNGATGRGGSRPTLTGFTNLILHIS